MTPENAAEPDAAALRSLLHRDRYPRSSRYDPRWVLGSYMGPHPLWTTESISEHLDLRPGMRILDLGCGRVASSIFLAREFDLSVWGVDILVSASDNWKRVQEAGLEDRVFPLHVDARSMPFARGYFDGAVSLGAYMYFGTDDTYLRGFLRFFRPGAQIGLVMHGLREEYDRPPGDLLPLWRQSFETWHSPEWWRHHFERTELVDVEMADLLPDGWSDWADWYELCVEHGDANPHMVRPEIEALRDDAGDRFNLVRVVLRVR